MATLVVYADTSDGYVQSQNTNVASMRSGSSLSATTTGGVLQVGQRLTAGLYIGYLGAVEFDTSSLGSGSTVSSVALELNLLENNSLLTTHTQEVYALDWGGTLQTSHWRTPAQLGGMTLLASISTSGIGTLNQYKTFAENGTNFRSAINLTGMTRLVLQSSRFRNSNTPSADEYLAWSSANTVGTTSDPKLTIDWEAAPNTSIPVFMHHYRQQGIGG